MYSILPRVKICHVSCIALEYTHGANIASVPYRVSRARRMLHVLCIAATRGSYISNPNKGKWYKFNDTTVESFDMTDATLEAECFGGRYEVKVYDQSK